MNHSESIGQIATALAKAQAAMKGAIRDSDTIHARTCRITSGDSASNWAMPSNG